MAAEQNTTTLFACPSWAGKPPPGLHLDVLKGDKVVEKLTIDKKKFYLFGRNPEVCDFTIDHLSCSRIHSALVYHKHLKRVFIVDLNSTHGTFLGQIRLEPHKPQQVLLDTTLSFGASTLLYVLREKPQSQGSAAPGELKAGEDEELKCLLGLPEEETELNNLTEFNTTHNKRISTLAVEEGSLTSQRPKRRRRRSRVSFSDEEEVINPEEVDASVGRFRNMIQKAVVPVKKKNTQGHDSLGMEAAACSNSLPVSALYGDLPSTSCEAGTDHHKADHEAAAIPVCPVVTPNLAPDMYVTPTSVQPPIGCNSSPHTSEPLNEPRKKKYAKEAWPGKKPTPSLLI